MKAERSVDVLHWQSRRDQLVSQFRSSRRLFRNLVLRPIIEPGSAAIVQSRFFLRTPEL